MPAAADLASLSLVIQGADDEPVPLPRPAWPSACTTTVTALVSKRFARNPVAQAAALHELLLCKSDEYFQEVLKESGPGVLPTFAVLAWAVRRGVAWE